MGTLISKIPELDRLRFVPFPTRPRAMEKVVRAGHLVIGLGKNGKLYATGQLGQKAAFLPGSWPWLDEVLTALVRLGKIDQSVADRHAELVQERELRGDARHLLDSLDKDLRKHGLRLTKHQQAKLRKAAR